MATKKVRSQVMRKNPIISRKLWAFVQYIIIANHHHQKPRHALHFVQIKLIPKVCWAPNKRPLRIVRMPYSQCTFSFIDKNILIERLFAYPWLILILYSLEGQYVLFALFPHTKYGKVCYLEIFLLVGTEEYVSFWASGREKRLASRLYLSCLACLHGFNWIYDTAQRSRRTEMNIVILRETPLDSRGRT